MKKKLKITLNAPFTLGFALLCGLATLLCAVSGECTVLLFSTHASPMTDPLMYLRLFTHVLGHSGLPHLIGNLTLCAQDDNTRMGNEDFAYKKKILGKKKVCRKK